MASTTCCVISPASSAAALQQQTSTSTSAVAATSAFLGRKLNAAPSSAAAAAPSTAVAARKQGGMARAMTRADDASSSQKRVEALRAFQEKRAFKVIAGLQNFNAESVRDIVAAAAAGGATCVDIACDADLVRLALSVSRLPVCVSAVDPMAFLPAVAAGAHMVEIGNFDSFYSQGRVFTAQEVLALAKETRELLPNIALSVTVPHTLGLPEQVDLAEALEAAGVDIIQTEGGTSAAPMSAGVLGLIEKATPTLAAAHEISRAVSIPVMCASGLSAVTVPLAFAAGAAGVGVGSAINRLSDPVAMAAAVRSIADVLPQPSLSASAQRQ